MSQEYFRKFRARLKAETLSFGRSQGLALFAAVGAVIIQIVVKLVKPGDWNWSLWAAAIPYFLIVLAFCLWQVFKVPALIHDEQQTQIADLQAKLAAYTEQPSFCSTIQVMDSYAQRKDGGFGYDIFVKPHIVVASPPRMLVTEFKLQLDMLGMKYFPLERRDVDEWEMSVITGSAGDSTRIQVVPLSPMPVMMQSYRPYDGWLHFVTDEMVGDQFEQCNLRLLIETQTGLVYEDFSWSTGLTSRRSFRRKSKSAISVA